MPLPCRHIKMASPNDRQYGRTRHQRRLSRPSGRNLAFRDKPRHPLASVLADAHPTRCYATGGNPSQPFPSTRSSTHLEGPMKPRLTLSPSIPSACVYCVLPRPPTCRPLRRRRSILRLHTPRSGSKMSNNSVAGGCHSGCQTGLQIELKPRFSRGCGRRVLDQASRGTPFAVSSPRVFPSLRPPLPDAYSENPCKKTPGIHDVLGALRARSASLDKDLIKLLRDEPPR